MKQRLKSLVIVAFSVFLIAISPLAYSQDILPDRIAQERIAQENITPEENTTSENSAPENSAPENIAPENKIDGFPVTLADETLFVIQANVASFSAAERSQVITQRITLIADDVSIDLNNLEIEAEEDVTSLILGQKVIVTLTEADATAARQTQQNLAEDYRQIIIDTVSKYRQERSTSHLIRGAIYTVLSTLGLVISFVILGQVFPRLYTRIDSWRDTRIVALRIQNFELVTAQQVANILITTGKFIRWSIVLILLYIYIPLVLSFFPWTRRFADSFFQYFLAALEQIWIAFRGYLPNLFTLVFIVFLTYYIVKLIRFVFTQLEQDHVRIPGFYTEWAEPSSKLLTFLVIALALVIAFPYLPGFDSPAFQGVTVFLGVLLSLGSTAAVANAVAGVILIYTRAFQIGDLVKIADSLGNIEEKTLLVTRIRTPKNVLVTIPNAGVLSSNIINYSASVRDTNTPLVLHTTITLGYDVPWRQVYVVLLAAAKATPDILDEPEPFVLQTGLNDFYVSYELNAYTERSHRMPRIYSALHANIQDQCNEAGIEILSPHYSAIRDGHHKTIPEDYLEKDYTPPGFRVNPIAQVLDHLTRSDQK